jgi:hypothetical protein
MRRTSRLSVGPIALDGRAADACVELTNEKRGARTEQVRAAGATAVAIVADISEQASTEAVSAQAVPQLGGIDEDQIHPDCEDYDRHARGRQSPKRRGPAEEIDSLVTFLAGDASRSSPADGVDGSWVMH